MNKLALALLLLLAPACKTTGGIFLGLFPLPKFTSGTIEAGVYRPKDNSFAVWAPYSDAQDKTEKYEWTYCEIFEDRNDAQTDVRFGPAAFDDSTVLLTVLRLREDYALEDDNSIMAIAERQVEGFAGGNPYTIHQRPLSMLRPDMAFVSFTVERGGAVIAWGATYVGVKDTIGASITFRIPGFFGHSADWGEQLLNESWDKQRRFLRSLRVTAWGEI